MDPNGMGLIKHNDSKKSNLIASANINRPIRDKTIIGSDINYYEGMGDNYTGIKAKYPNKNIYKKQRFLNFISAQDD